VITIESDWSDYNREWLEWLQWEVTGVITIGSDWSDYNGKWLESLQQGVTEDIMGSRDGCRVSEGSGALYRQAIVSLHCCVRWCACSPPTYDSACSYLGVRAKVRGRRSTTQHTFSHANTLLYTKREHTSFPETARDNWYIRTRNKKKNKRYRLYN